jgi:fructooligosaccharide transport system permease protein
MSALTFVILPVLVLLLTMQKYYVQGIAGAGLKN